MNETIFWVGFALALIVVVLAAALLLKQPGKKNPQKKLRKRGQSPAKGIKAQKKGPPSVKSVQEKTAAKVKKSSKDKAEDRVNALVIKHPEMVSQVLRQWMKKK